MRAFVVPLLALAVGCQAGGELQLEHLSTMSARTKGLVLMADGQVGHAAMAGTTCRFDTLNGWLIDDFDLPTREERVVDTLGGAVLGTNAEGLYDVQELDFIPADAVTDARYLRGGEVVWLQGDATGCSLSYSDGGSVAVDGVLCEAGPEAIGVVRDDGSMIVGTAEDTVVVDEGGARSIADGADFVVYDARTDLVYLAMEGQPIVRAVTRDGDPVWSTHLGGRITALEKMGRRGKVVAMVASDGEARMVVVHGPSGEPELDVEAPSADVDLEVSEDGTTLAVIHEREIYFYDVYDRGDDPKERRTLGVEDRQPTFSD
jgi:hypothetical protein